MSAYVQLCDVTNVFTCCIGGSLVKLISVLCPLRLGVEWKRRGGGDVSNKIMANPYQRAIFVLREISKIESHIVPLELLNT